MKSPHDHPRNSGGSERGARAWEGNVRELQQVIERAAILAERAPEIMPEHFYFPTAPRRLAVAAKAV